MTLSLSVKIIAQKIFIIRKKKIMLDNDLARLYEVSTRRLNEQVKRNIRRFPEDFMFRLTKDEFDNLMSQFATSNNWGGRRKMPLAFTEQGVAMLSSVLNSERAIQVNIQIMRAFVKIKEVLITNRELARRLEDLEKRYGNHDEKINIIFEAIRQLLEPPPILSKPKIGFNSDKSV